MLLWLNQSLIIDTKKNVEWKTPEEAQKKCTVAES